jgi:hypothetical protein
VRLIRTAACVVFACLVYSAFALAQISRQQSNPPASTATVPRLIQVKGSVHDETGKPLSGHLGITFTLYKDANDQVAVWQENQNASLDSAGHYSVLLGATNEAGLPLEIFSAGEARWLGIRPDGQAEQPRILFLSVAYALKAADTEMLGGKPASAFVLADSLYSSSPLGAAAGANTADLPSGAKIPTVGLKAGPLLMAPTETGCGSGVNSDGNATLNSIAMFSPDGCDIESSAISQSGTTVAITGELLLPPTGTATGSPGFNSQPLDLQASGWNGSSAVTQDFQWMAEPGNPSLNLLFGSGTTPTETGLSIASSGVINFASGQNFPLPAGAVTNNMLANHSITVATGTGLSGGGTVQLGGTITLTNTSPSSGGTVTNVATGTGLTGGPVSTTGTISLDTTYTNAHYLQLSGGTLTGGLTGTGAAFTGTLNVNGAAFIGGTLNPLTGATFPPLGTANASQGYAAAPLDLQASTYFPSSGPSTYVFRWQAGAVGNNSTTVTPGASLNLYYGVPGFITQVLSVAGNGVINFAPGQTYPGLFSTNAQTSTYATTPADFASCATIPVSSGTFTITLVASSSQPASGQCVFIINYGSGAVTIASSGQQLNGVTSSLTLTPGSPTTPNGAFIVSDGTNYEAQLFGGGGGSGGSGTVTSVAETINNATSSGIFAVTGSPVQTSGTLNISLSGTSGGIPYFSSGSVLKSSGGLTGIVRGGSPPTASEISGDASTSGSNAVTVRGLNGTLLSGLATGLLKNTTSTGVPSIATSSDIVGLFTGCSGTQYLGADGKCHAASGSGTVTSVTAASPLTGGTITTTGTIGLMSCSSAGQILIWSGTSWACGASGGGGGVSGTTDGIAYFSSSSNLTSTAAPANGQILIGSTGAAPVLGTLTAGANVSITNGPGSITISATGGGGGGNTILPFFATGSQRTGGNQGATKNVNKLWGFLLPYSVTTTQVTYDVSTADNTTNNYDLGIYNNSGALLLDIGATPGTVFAPSKVFKTLPWRQGSTTLPAGRYYIGFTTNCPSACGAIAAGPAFVSYAINLSSGISTGGVLATTVTPPADVWNTGNQPMIVMH